MGAILALIPAFPLAAFLVLGLLGRRLPRKAVSIAGVGGAGLSALLALGAAGGFASTVPPGGAIARTYGTWFETGSLRAAVSLRLDALSLIFTLVITFVGALILFYSTEFMRGEEGYGRFFAAMNLFVGSMLILVLSDNLLLLYLGWEGVGLCSYLLIGFWYRDPANGRAARKAFLLTRIGDTALAAGLFLLWTNLGTLEIPGVLQMAAARWPAGSSLAVLSAALILGGAVGKSAQLPLQTWLPDAMAGPTPVSALIHAATMVAAGVYLVARMNALFVLAPAVQAVVAGIGALTLLLAGLSALAQTDIKRVLAYSTMSQVGYMFLALGVGSWPAAVFHFMTHAFFKALLFLAAGAILVALDEEKDIRRMGGLRKSLPLVFWTFLAGAASLAALPLVTAGFSSKGWILRAAWAGPGGKPWLWAAGAAGAFITALYAFRLVFLVFSGPSKLPVRHRPGPKLQAPLVVLALLSIFGGLFRIPWMIAAGARPKSFPGEATLEILSAGIILLGLALAYGIFVREPGTWTSSDSSPSGKRGIAFIFSGWGFDRAYERLFVRPLLWLARINRDDVLDLPFLGLAQAGRDIQGALSRAQSGRLRRYAAVMAAGAIVVIALAVLL